MVWQHILLYNIIRYQIAVDPDEIFTSFLDKLWSTFLPQMISIAGYLFWKFFPLADDSLITASMIPILALIIIILGITKYSRG